MGKYSLSPEIIEKCAGIGGWKVRATGGEYADVKSLAYFGAGAASQFGNLESFDFEKPGHGTPIGWGGQGLA